MFPVNIDPNVLSGCNTFIPTPAIAPVPVPVPVPVYPCTRVGYFGSNYMNIPCLRGCRWNGWKSYF
jgi:hypothetical protein